MDFNNNLIDFPDKVDIEERNFLKCVVVGDGAVGKTSLLMSYATNTFPGDYVPTVFDTYCASLKVRQKRYELGLFDTAGQEDYSGIRKLSYPSTHVFIVCFSVVIPDSFENVKLKWIPEIKLLCPNTPFVVVGTQSDLRKDSTTIQNLEKKRQSAVTIQNAAKTAKKLHAVKYIECSALTHSGVKNVFDEAVLSVLGTFNKCTVPKMFKCKLPSCLNPAT